MCAVCTRSARHSKRLPPFPFPTHRWPWQHRLKAVHCWCGVVWACQVQHCRPVVVALLTLGSKLHEVAAAAAADTVDAKPASVRASCRCCESTPGFESYEVCPRDASRAVHR
jgi:hypothetical protein